MGDDKAAEEPTPYVPDATKLAPELAKVRDALKAAHGAVERARAFAGDPEDGQRVDDEELLILFEEVGDAYRQALVLAEVWADKAATR